MIQSFQFAADQRGGGKRALAIELKARRLLVMPQPQNVEGGHPQSGEVLALLFYLSRYTRVFPIEQVPGFLTQTRNHFRRFARRNWYILSQVRTLARRCQSASTTCTQNAISLDWRVSRACATRFVDIFGRCWYTESGKTAMSPIRLRRVLGSEAAPRLPILREPLVLQIRYPDRGVSHARAH